LNDHCGQRDDAWMLELLQDTDFSESGDRHAFGLIFHEDSLQRHELPGGFVSGFMDFTAKAVGRTSSLQGKVTYPKVPSPSLFSSSKSESLSTPVKTRPYTSSSASGGLMIFVPVALMAGTPFEDDSPLGGSAC
jgi:hypothetical protein